MLCNDLGEDVIVGCILPDSLNQVANGRNILIIKFLLPLTMTNKVP